MYDEAYVFEMLYQSRKKEMERITLIKEENLKQYPFYCRFPQFKNLPACRCGQLDL
jgi:hypothetical protein